MAVLFSLLVLALMIGALIDIITREDGQVKHLPKVFWIILVVILPLAGSIIWFLVGREYGDSGVRIPRMRGERRGPAAPAAPSVPPAPVDTRTTEQQIADLDREIEEWRLRAEIERRRRESGDGTPSDGNGSGS
ncbi:MULTISPECIES: PLD nuclease N-terminal domain-containing protein [Microbacterium]|uniref:PLD nuclease N-terminal domain-containing protein n=1 Tax=Microbacterium resistens TaxID=156977 RepID=A0ABY3RUX8_9MICO|nr:PLD nuclease N-terminal domain-containing protein [Microbacterium resistens]MBW1639702.1 PLDc_N domain-containing protein [Microbacterium resistens]UGS26730.1 PLD nuclease N-terminal domain-containing protein [Microbacterium resistens]